MRIGKDDEPFLATLQPSASIVARFEAHAGGEEVPAFDGDTLGTHHAVLNETRGLTNNPVGRLLPAKDFEAPNSDKMINATDAQARHMKALRTARSTGKLGRVCKNFFASC